MLTERLEGEWTLTLLSVDIPVYGACVALAAALALACLLVRARKTGLQRGWAQVLFLLCAPCALLASRLLFVACDASFDLLPPVAALYPWQGGHSMLGALLGACAGCLLAARLLRADKKALLDALCPALLLFVCVARLGEYFTSLGVGAPLMDAPESFLIERGEYDAYLRVYIFEAFLALALFFASLSRRKARAGERFLATVVWFCASQVLMESLRFDRHMRFSFVSASQVGYMLALGVALAYLAIRALRDGGGRALAFTTLAAFPAAALALITLEFALDRSSLSKLALYAVYTAILAALALAGAALQRKWRETHG